MIHLMRRRVIYCGVGWLDSKPKSTSGTEPLMNLGGTTAIAV